MSVRPFRFVRAAYAPLIIGCVTLPLSAVQAAEPAHACVALAKVNNQLYLSNENGTLISQFPTDSSGKSSISLSPDGQKVIYVSDSNPGFFTVVDNNGRVNTLPIPSLHEGPFIGVMWDSAQILKFRYHVGRDNDVFQFYNVAPNSRFSLQKVGKSIAGVDCATHMGNASTTCISENKLVANKKILMDLNPISKNNVATFANADIMVGTTFSSQTTPSFQIRVEDISNEVTFIVTYPDGSWSKSSVPLGSVLPFVWEDVSYGLSPVGIDRNRQKVTANLTRSVGLLGTFDPAVSSFGNKFATVVTHDAGGAKLHFAQLDGAHAPVSAAIGDFGPVTAISYTAPDALVLQSALGFLLLPIRGLSEQQSTLQLGVLRPLPSVMNVNVPAGSARATIEGWACH